MTTNVDGFRSPYLRFGLKGFREVLPDEVIQRVARKRKADARRRALTLPVHFWLLVYGLCDPTITGLATLLGSASVALQEVLDEPALTKPLHKSALSHRNTRRRVKCFQDLFRYLVDEAQGARHVDPALKQFATVSLIDASLLDLGLSLFKFFNTSRNDAPTKAQVKMGTVFDLQAQVPEAFCLGPGNRHEVRMARKLVQDAKRALFIFDLGYWDYGFFEKLAASGNFFVSRVKSNADYQVVRRLNRRKQDFLVRMGGAKTRMKRTLRLVGVPHEGQTYWYLTNLMSRKSFSPEQIARLYRRRWDIELFFFRLKEILGVRRLFSRTREGIQIEIYAALCTYLIVKILMHRAARKHGLSIEDLSFRKCFHYASRWIRARVGRPGPVRPEEVECLLDLLVALGRAETRSMKRKAS